MITSGVVFLDKPLGWTSRRAVNEMIRLFSIAGKKRIKAGHAGTLDPLATGMLPILLGEATRFAELGLHAEKCYTVTLDLSYQTETLDCEGEVTARFDKVVKQADIETVLPIFTGEIEQIPPMYSAIRMDGKRAHAIARSGETVEMKARNITIHKLDLINFNFPLLTLNVRCSKGTYIRSLARDIGESLGLGGCVTSLRRTSTGGWSEAMMVTPEMLEKKGADALVPIQDWLRDFTHFELNDIDAQRFLNGQRLQLDTKLEGDVSVLSQGVLLGTGEMKQGLRKMVLHPMRILPSAQVYFLKEREEHA